MNNKCNFNDYVNNVNLKQVNNILKFYQNTVNIQEFNNINKDNKNKDVDGQDFELPDFFIEEISLENLLNKEKIIFEEINSFIESELNTYFLPIFIINKCMNLKKGIYSMDFNKKVLYKYKEFDMKIFNNKEFDENFNMCICYFLNLYNIVNLDGELGFINGILQVGQIYEKINNISEKNGFNTYSCFVPQQAFSHNLGINPRLQLFIKNQFLKET